LKIWKGNLDNIIKELNSNNAISMDSKGKLNNTNRKFRNFKDKIADSYKTTNNIDSN